MKTETWVLLSMHFDAGLQDALQQQHHAAQFIAMAGRHLIPQQPDDSNTSMDYLAEKSLIAGRELLSGIRLALNPAEMILCLLEQNSTCNREIKLNGKTKPQVFEEMKKMLSSVDINTTNLKEELHYEIPVHALDKGNSFQVGNKKLFLENTMYRHNAQIVLEKIIQSYTDTEPVRIWPHHFDTGTLIALSKNDQGEIIRSAGLGWAIPDTMVAEPYGYVSYGSKNLTGTLKGLPDPGRGRWMVPAWNGAVLPLSKILEANTSQGQYALTKEFFQQGIQMLSTLK